MVTIDFHGRKKTFGRQWVLLTVWLPTSFNISTEERNSNRFWNNSRVSVSDLNFWVNHPFITV